MSKHEDLDHRSKLRSSKLKNRANLGRVSTEEEVHADNDPSSVLDDIWATPYDQDAHALSQLEVRLYKQKRKIYEVQRLLGQTVETITILLSMLHATLEDL